MNNQQQNKQQQIIKKILISGGSGFIGTGLIKYLQELGQYDIYTLVRRPVRGGYEIEWDPDRSSIDVHAIETIHPDIVIHLSGENVMGFWTEQKKRKILESRTKSTKLLADTISSLKNKPELFICASGCTYYGTDVYHPVDEYSPKGTGFFSDVVEKWERACDSLKNTNNNNNEKSISLQDSNSTLQESTDSLSPSSNSINGAGETSGIRVVNLRIGLVFDRSGAFLSTIYYPFKFGLGGVMGSGNQWMPWISLRDTCNIFQYIIIHKDLKGPINLTNPNPITNSSFTRLMGYVLKRPTIFWVPEFLIRLVLGKEMANETILSSQRVIPTKLLNHGYKFLDLALYDTLMCQYSSDRLSLN